MYIPNTCVRRVAAIFQITSYESTTILSKGLETALFFPLPFRHFCELGKHTDLGRKFNLKKLRII